MPPLLILQIIFGLGLGVLVMLPGVRERSVASLVGDLTCSLCSAVMEMAYYSIRLNAAIGGWVIVLFGYTLVWQLGFVASKAGLLGGVKAPRWDAGWLKAGATRLQLARFAFFLLPALYLGSILTARIWYPPPLGDPLTRGVENAGGLKARLDLMIPLGTKAAVVRDSLERHAFHCLDRPDEVRMGGTFTHLDCNTRDFAADTSRIHFWQLLMTFRHDSLVDMRIGLTPNYH